MTNILDVVGSLDRNQMLISASVAVVAWIGVNKLLGGQDARKLIEQQKRQQSIEVLPGIRRGMEFKDGLREYYDPKLLTLNDIWRDVVSKFANEPCLGSREKLVNGAVGDYQYMTYKEVNQQVESFARGLLHLGHRMDEPLGIYSVNRKEWIIADLASQFTRSPSVALYDTLGQNAIEFIIKHSEIKFVVCAGKQLNIVLNAVANCPTLKNIVTMDPISEEQRAKAEQLQVRIHSWSEVLQLGAAHPRDLASPRPEHIYTIMYTSGTTGDPKGVILTHGNLVAELTGVRTHDDPLFSPDDVHMSYLPLAHSFERATVYTLLSFGARIGFYQGNVNELFNDIAALRPTFLVGAPRVWSRLYDKLTMTINNSGALKQKLFQWGFAAKQAALKNGTTTPLWDKILFSKMKARLGGRVRFILSGSAPLDKKLGEFLKICFCCQVLEGYGLTENFAGASITRMDETQFGHVGRPLSCMEVKLADIPEMNYFAVNGQGEILLRGPNVFKGYHRDPEKTKEALEADGFFHTGDVGKWNENGTLSIIDRKKNIFKLAQGEYVAVEYLEGVYIRSSFVSQIWVYGSSYKRYVVAVVYPDPDYLVPWAAQNNISGDFKALCQNPQVQEAIQKDLTKTGQDSKLHGFEYIKAVHVVSDPFTVDNDLMTPSFKLRRPNLVKYFQKQIDDMYIKIGDA